MPTDFKLKLNTALADRRVQAGAAIGVSALAVVAIISGASAWGINDHARAEPVVSDHAQLAIQLEQPKPTPGPHGQLAVLDPNQLRAASNTAEPLTPEMKALVERDRREQAQMVAEQRAFDARIRAEMANSETVSYRTAPSPLARPAIDRPDPRPDDQHEPPARWTSNTDDRAEDTDKD